MSDNDPSPQGIDDSLSPDTPDGASAGAGTRGAGPRRKTRQVPDKRRKIGLNPRGVANLNPEQLDKKRANDREAQRAIRQRTKNYIQSLERENAFLKSQNVYQELQHAIRQKEVVERENFDIKKRIAAMMNMLETILAGNGIRGPSVEAAPNHSPINAYTTHTGPLHADNNVAGFDMAGSNTSRSSPTSWNVPAPYGSTTESPNRRSSTMGNTRDQGSISGILRTTSQERDGSGLIPMQRPEINTHPSHPSLPADHHITLASPTAHTSQADRDSRPAWEIVPPWTDAASLFDGLLLKFTIDAKHRLNAGTTSEFELIGPDYPNFAAITYPSADIPCHAISKFLRDILAPFPDVTIVANKVAIAYIMFLILRWHISPTQKNFDRLPLWTRPNPWQVTIRHAIWIDHVPWPDMRSQMVRNPHLYPFDQFFVPHTKTESINWDHGEAAMYARPKSEGGPGQADGNQVLSHAYETHIRDLNNWTLGPAFAKAFPSLASSCRITTRGEDERRELAEQMKNST